MEQEQYHENINTLLKLINLLANGEFCSKKYLSKKLDLNFIIINKYVQNIRDWGLDIYEVINYGYRLHTPLFLLNKTKIQSYSSTGQIIITQAIDSTNQYLINRINTIQSGDVCLAEYQSQGRGRYGHKWISPFGRNIYLSIYWRFRQKLFTPTGLSLIVGIIVTEVLHYFGAKNVRLKWPNDLYINNRKLAGILVEIINKSNNFTHIIIGIGINLAMHKPTTNDTNPNWISLQDDGIIIDRDKLSIELIDKLRYGLQQFEHNKLTKFIERWKTLDIFFNQPIKLLIGEREIKGINRGIDANGALLLEYKGKIYSYLGNNVSLRNF